ncbi:MAG: nuclear transport factor 2 family protein [Coleofasciculus sp. G1-WW12-02]|uniref:nuclear transport factor 2 family protein n=1 Tax=Coleofasciculus sp. G1-WW12-02 TaxID=3068483 RepID=UPI0032F9AE44
MSKRQQKFDTAQLSIGRVIIAAIALAILSYSNLTDSAVAANLHSCSNLSKGSIITMISPDTKPIKPTITELIQRQAQAWETADSDKIIADFAEDSVFIVPVSKFIGKSQIKAAADDYFAKVTDIQITIKTIIFQHNKGAVEWIWYQKSKETDERSKTDDAIIFEIEQGKIKYWREYMDNQSK